MRTIIVALASGLASSSCGDDTSGGDGGSSGGADADADADAEAGGDAGDGGDETAGGDGVACVGSCAQSLEDCCFGEQPASGFPSGARCPSSVFPDNWACDEQDQCVLDPGCDWESVDSDEEACANSVTGLSCRAVGGVGLCVALCSVDADCTDTHSMAGTTCSQQTDQTTGQSSESYCRQPTFF